MKLIARTVENFSEILASDSPAPGGGSTAALEGALGAALLHMVGSLTSGKAKYAEHQPLITEMLAKSEDLRAKFIDIIDRDTEAFNDVTAVFNMPKSTDEEKAARKLAMQNALKGCTKTPYEMMVLALATLELAKTVAGKTNASAASDFGVAALSLKAAVQGAWLNILINISGLEDQEFAAKYRQEGEAILAKALPLADELYKTVLDSLS